MNLLRIQVVLWKNLLIRRRYWFMTICEAFLPITLFLLVVYARSKIHGLNKVQINTPTYFNPLEIDLNGLNVDATHILYCPNTTYFKDIIHRTTVKFQIPGDRVEGFETIEKLLKYYYQNNNDTVIAVTFDGQDSKKFSYKLRYHDIAGGSKEYLTTSKLYKNFFQFEPNSAPDYYDNGFLALQKALDLSFMEKSLNQNLDNNISLFIKEFPYPPHKVDPIAIVMKELLPLITLFSFIFLCPAVLKRVVEEKHSGTKELMKMVGMKSWMLWLGWFVYGMLPIFFSIVVIVILLKVPIFHVEYPPIQYSDGTIIFCFLLFYSMAALCSCFAISSCFTKPTLTVIIGILIWILSYFIPKSFIEDSRSFSWGTNMLLLLLPNMALHYGYSAIAPYEERELGIQWHNIGKSGSEDINDATLLNVFLMLIVDIMLYLAFSMYMDGINPGKYGVKKSYLFPIYHLINLLRSKDRHSKVAFESVGLENVEDGQGLVKGIQIQNLVKRYGTKMAVNNLNLDIYQNQITVLLGHNGAGKSTTMSIITGMIEATSGEVKMNGLNVKSNMDEVRQTLGLCPQHNLLFPDMTVGQHLIFFAKLKGLSSKNSEVATDDLLKKLDMSEKKNEMANALSGGMKRKLCLGMALIGGSKVLILDEPSSGLDPESRRELWDLLLKWRGEKTILITTHFMEEADALGDWIAIMAEGTLQCYGTPMFLKKKYHTGYHLSLMVDGTVTDEHRRKIDGLIKDRIVEAHVNSENGNNIVYVLPEKNDEVIKLLTLLEERKEELKVLNMSINATSLEDVFLKTRSETNSNVEDNVELNALLDLTLTELQEDSYFRNLRTLFQKKKWFIQSKLSIYLIPVVIALLFFIMTSVLSVNSSDYFSSNGPELKLRLSSYGSNVVYFNVTHSNTISELSESYYRQLVESNGCNASDVGNVAEAIVAMGTDNIIFYKKHMVAGAELKMSSKIEAVALYNAIAIHSSPISLNLITDTIAKSLLGSDYSISISNWPLETVNKDTTPQDYSKEKVALMWLVLVPIGCLFLLGSFIVFPHIEIATGFIRQQYMCGVSSFTYWTVNFISDFMIYFIEAVFLAGLLCFSSNLFRGWSQFGSLMQILVLYGLAGIPLTYLFARKKTASGGFAFFIISMIFIGIILTVAVEVFLFSQMDYYERLGERLKMYFVSLLPQVGLTHFGMQFARKAVENYNMDLPGKTPSLCYKSHPCCNRNSVECLSYRQYHPTSDIWLMLWSTLVYSLINIFLDLYCIKKLYCNILYQFERYWYGYELIDTQTNVIDNDKDKYKTLKAKKLNKHYSGRSIVQNINFTLKNGDCLGILGVNGAGKTTTFRLLTLEEIVDAGRVELSNEQKTIKMDDKDYLKQLGYCPQVDALNFALTGRQILTTIASLRGVQNVAEVVDTFLQLFGLTQFADEPCGHYSGGNKRKLSLALSLIGYRQFVLLDEPTNGVDPSARRKCWSLIKQYQKKKHLSFILTSHSMVECEALCDDLKIMKDGKFHTEGPIATLKSEFGGFSVKLKLATKNERECKLQDEVDFSARKEIANDKVDGVEGLKRFIMNNFEGEIKDEHAGLLHFYLKHDNRTWSEIFNKVHALKMEYPDLIVDYAISEASLEDVFLSVARAEGERKIEKKGFFQKISCL